MVEYRDHRRLPCFRVFGGPKEVDVRDLQCEPAWRAQQPDELEFVAIGTAKAQHRHIGKRCGYAGNCDRGCVNIEPHEEVDVMCIEEG